jgi:hypothetical protein
MAEEIKQDGIEEFATAAGDSELDSFLFGEQTEVGDDPLFGNPPVIEGQPEAEFGKPAPVAAKTVEELTDPEPEIEPEVNLILQLLEAKGIKDGLVKIEEEDGTEVDVPFNELTPEEQFNILNTQEEPDLGLDENELNTIAFLRENKVTLEETIDYFSKKAVEEALRANQATESIADFTDEEIFVYDLLAKFKDIYTTQEQIQIELDKQAEHPELFKQKVDILRNEYLQLEQDELKNEEVKIQQQEQEKFTKKADSLVAVAKEVADIGGIDIELEDKQEVLGFILNKDVNGVSEFDKLTEDPKALFEMAWYAKKGKEAFDVIHDYYRKEIADASKKGYEKGKAEAEPVKEAPKGNGLKNIVKPKPNQSTKSPVSEYPNADILYRDL